ncbi:MAG: T9SS type A sorting domain-containing protein [Bacteroidales bacterium]|nr:T9SS type A sorting domain-containing protein [Bacteroidales bacterium]
MTIKQFLVALSFIVSGYVFAQTPWQSTLLSVGNDGSLTYKPDVDGFILPDFSHAGYKGGGVELPIVSTVKIISPIVGDNTSNIQNAIDYVGNLPLDGNGIRGAVLLQAGKYDVYGTIYVNKDGIVLRGIGDGANPATSTIIYARGNNPAQRDVLILGVTSQINGKTQLSGTKSFITDNIVPVGSFTFNVDNAALYQVGDRIIVYHPCTQKWIDAVNQGGVPYPDPSAPTDPDERWVVNQLPISYNRFITNISGNQITIDAPVFYTLKNSISASYIYKPNVDGLINQVGLENLRIDIETLGGEDEDHAWQAARFKSCENSWAKNCTFIHFGQSGIITEACTRSTFIDCSAIDPVAIITGERMYNFNTYVYSQLNLFQNCYARNGRHHYVSNGTSSTSGNVFLRCVSDAVNNSNEGHRQWTQGMLYDNHKEINLIRDFVLGLYNRVNLGTGHGWAAVHSVLWNCDVTSSYGKIALQKPPTGQNYAIGCFAKSITGNPISATNFPLGFVEGQNKGGLVPNSLYESQLANRLKLTAIKQTKKEEGVSIFPSLAKNEINVVLNTKGIDTLLRVRNSTGHIESEIKTTDNQAVISTNKLSSGLYFLECITENKTQTLKFLKK